MDTAGIAMAANDENLPNGADSQVGVTARLVANGMAVDGTTAKAVLTITLGKPHDVQTADRFNASLSTLPTDLYWNLFDANGAMQVTLEKPNLAGSARPHPGQSGASTQRLRVYRSARIPSNVGGSVFNFEQLTRIEDLWCFLVTGSKTNDRNVWSELALLIHTGNSGGDAGGAAPSTASAENVLTQPTGDTAVSVLARRAYALLAEIASVRATSSKLEVSVEQAAAIEIGQSIRLFPEREKSADDPSQITEQQRLRAGEDEAILDHQQKQIAATIRSPLEKAQQYAQSRTEYQMASASAETVATSLTGKFVHKDTSCFQQIACLKDQDGGVAMGIRQANDQHRGTHYAATREPKRQLEDDGNEPKQDIIDLSKTTQAAQQRIFQIQSNVRLSRLFGFVIDIELPDFVGPEGLAPVHLESDEQFVFLRADINADKLDEPVADQGAALLPSVWTLARWAPALPDLQQDSFWPATREALDTAWLQQSGAANLPSDEVLRSASELRGGILDLGTRIACSPSDEEAQDHPASIPRFELTSLDASPAVETEINQEYAELEASAYRKAVEALETDEDGDAKPVAKTMERSNLPTAGFLLLDRCRGVKTVDELVRKNDRMERQEGEHAFLHDAQDLLIGYSPDVGVFDARQNRSEWRSLVNRKQILRDPRISDANDPEFDWIEDFLQALDGDFEAQIRRSAGLTTLATRQAQHKLGTENETCAVLFADQTVFRWDGDLGGIDSIPSVFAVNPDKDLPLTELMMPLSADQHRGFTPPNGRFGYTYWFGCRAVFQGAVKIPLREAADFYRSQAGKTAILPSLDAPGKRLLRLERVDAPTWLLHGAETESYRATTASDRRFALQSARQVVLRTAFSSQDGTPVALTGQTKRILVPPAVSLDFASRHGVFDSLELRDLLTDGKNPPEKTRPPGGLRNVEQDAEPTGGFPSVDGLGGRLGSLDPFDESRPLPGTLDENEPDSAPVPFDGRQEAAFFYKRFDETKAFDPSQGTFYPDPAAHTIALAVRRTVDGQWYDGDPLTIDLSGAPYPDTPVVEVIFNALENGPSTAATRLRKHTDVLSALPSLGALDRNLNFRSDRRDRSNRIPARQVRANLQWGEDIEILAWCVPSAAQLYHWFNIVETTGTLLRCRGADGDTGFLEQLAKLFGTEGGEHPTETGDSEFNDGSCGIAGHQRPSLACLKQLADKLHACLLKHPLSEIVSTQTLGAVHAVSRPNFAPDFLPLSQEQYQASYSNGELTNVRRIWDADTQDDGLAVEPEIQRAQFIETTPDETWGDAASPSQRGAVDVMFGGRFQADLDTIASVTLQGTMAAPFAPVLDDPNRGLTRAQRRDVLEAYKRSISQDTNAASNDAALPALPALDEAASQALTSSNRIALRAEQLLERQFGFKVRLDGEVQPLRDTQTDLVKVSRLSLLDGPALGDGLETVDLNRTFDSRSSALQNGSQATQSAPDERAETPLARRNVERTIFQDTLARKVVQPRLVSKSRFEEYFVPNEDFSEPGVRRGGSLPTADIGYERSSAEGGQANDGVWIKATERPPVPKLFGAIPSFVWTTQTVQGFDSHRRVERHSKLRIQMPRGWNASGENERLGIVLWPPELYGGRTGSLNDVVNRTLPSIVDNMSDYGLRNGVGGPADGSGGAGEAIWTPYVTRWGSDPIRSGPQAGDWFVPKEVFRDTQAVKDEHTDWDNDRVVLIENVAVPLPSRPPQETDLNSDDIRRGQQFFHASLLAFRPKFDYENELWYIDVELDPLDLPYPFMRVALVRYQHQALEGLKVSEPVTQMCQLTPYREVQLRVEPTLGARTVLHVAVRGRGSTRSWSGGPGLGLQVRSRPEDRPAIRMAHRRLQPHSNNRNVIVSESIHPSRQHPANSVTDPTGGAWTWDSQEWQSNNDTPVERARLVERSRLDREGLIWENRIILDQAPDFPNAPTQEQLEGKVYDYLYIEEVRRMETTQPEDEREFDSVYGESGPLFSAVIPLFVKSSES